MTPDDLATVLDWARAEGWNPGLEDASAFFAADPGGFLVGVVDDEPVAAISAVRHAPDVGFVGLYIVRPAFRGRGHGLALWRAGLARLADAAVGLDGVLAQQANYAREGFLLAHRNVRWAGAAPTPPDDAGTAPLAEAPFEAICAYDAAITGYPRAAFLRAWTAPTATRRGAVAMADGAIRGYGVVRACVEGAKIGPLFADDAATAAALLGALARLAPARPIILDAPEPNAAAGALARDLGMAPVFETARMWRGPAPAEDLGRTWGVASFELG